MKTLYKFLILSLTVFVLITACDSDNEDVSTSIVVNSITPSEGGGGTFVTIDGTGLNNVLHVVLEKDPYTSIEFSQSENQISFTIPEDAYAGNKELVLVMPNDQRHVIDYYVVPGPPIISKMEPGAAPVGETAQIQGSSFVDVQSVKIGNITLNSSQYTIAANQSSISFTVPEGIENNYGKVEVTTALGTVTSSSFFFVGTEFLIDDFDGNSNPNVSWGGAYGSAGGDESGIAAWNTPTGGNGSFLKIECTEVTATWGGGLENSSGTPFGVEGTYENVIMVADVYTSVANSYFRIETTLDAPADRYTYSMTPNDKWETKIISLVDLEPNYGGTPGGYDVPIDPASIDQIKIMFDATLGNLCAVDNIRFIKLDQ